METVTISHERFMTLQRCFDAHQTKKAFYTISGIYTRYQFFQMEGREDWLKGIEATIEHRHQVLIDETIKLKAEIQEHIKKYEDLNDKYISLKTFNPNAGRAIVKKPWWRLFIFY